MEKKKVMVQSKMNKNKETPLTKLLKNKGYKKIYESETSDLYVAIDEVTGSFCLIVANEGSQFFKEIVIPDSVIDYLFSLEYKNFKYDEPKEKIQPSVMAQNFIDLQGYKLIDKFERNVKEIKITNEALVRNIVDQKVISILQMSYVDDIFTNIINVNLAYEEVMKFTDYILELAQKAQAEFKKEKEEEKENV